MTHGSLTRGALSCAAALVLGCGADGLDDAELGTSEDAVVVCAAGPTVDGIDVSYYQGSVNWGAVAGDGKAFGIARINHGDFMDPEFDANWAGMKAAGIVRGAYQYFDAGSDALAQAQIVVDKLGKLGAGDLPAVIDIESADGQGPAKIVSQVQTWLDHVEAGTGKKPIVYTAKYFWQDNVGSDQFVDYPLWVANYYVDCPNLPDGAWPGWAMHQHADNGSVAGIDGAVDLNRFNGTADDLAAFASAGAGAYGAELIETGYPLTMIAGDSAKATVTLRNSGGTPWDAATHLGTTEPRDRQSAFVSADWVSANRADAVVGQVNAGDSYTFEFTLGAPGEPGVYREYFNLVQEGVAWFSDAGQGGPGDTAILMEITVVPGGESTSAGVGGGSGSGSGNGAGANDFRSNATADLEGDVCSLSAAGARIGVLRSASPLACAAALLLLGARRRRRR
jgi:lysozyme